MGTNRVAMTRVLSSKQWRLSVGELGDGSRTISETGGSFFLPCLRPRAFRRHQQRRGREYGDRVLPVHLGWGIDATSSKS